jgi:hypothetical protein
VKREGSLWSAKLRFGPVAVIALGLVVACLFTAWQTWRNAEISEARLRTYVESAAVAQFDMVTGRTPAEVKLEDFQWKRTGSRAEFSARLAIDRSLFRNLVPGFEPKGTGSLRITGTSTVVERSETVLGIDLSRLSFGNTEVTLKPDDPRTSAELYEAAWRDEGREDEWLCDLGMIFGDIVSVRTPTAEEQALRLRSLRRKKAFYEATFILKLDDPPGSRIWTDRLDDEKRKVLADIKASAEWKAKLASDVAFIEDLLNRPH